MSTAILTLGRVFLAGIFVVTGIKKALNSQGTAGFMESAGLPFPEILLVATIIIEVVGGLMVATGFKARIAAGVLFLFMIPVTATFHPPTDPEQFTSFLKNLSVMGGLLVLFGAQGLIKKD